VVARRNSEGFVAMGINRTSALTVLCLITEALNGGSTHLVEAVIHD